MAGWTRDHKILIVDDDPQLAEALASALSRQGAQARGVGIGDALPALGQLEPAVLVTPVPEEGTMVALFLRRVRDDYMGQRPRMVGIAVGQRATPPGDINLDAILLPSTPSEILIAACAPVPATALSQETWNELARASLLGADPQETVNELARRLGLAARAKDCLVLASVAERQLLGTARGKPVGPEDPIWELAQLSLASGAEVLGEVKGQGVAVVAFPFESSGQELGAAVLLNDRPPVASPALIDAMRAMAPRFSAELTWRGSHERLAQDNERLRQSSLLDPLLSVWTRAALEHALPGELSGAQRRGEQVTFAALNLRGLRQINEAHGHDVGDQALRQLAQVTRHTLRAQDLVARWAGDLLVVVLAGANQQVTRQVLDRLLTKLSREPIEAGGAEVVLQATCAIAPLGGEDDSGEAAIARALAGLAAGKRRGEQVVVVEPGMDMAHHAPPGLEAGVTLGGCYQVRHEISRGAMGVVYRAEDLGLGRQVALKTLRQDLARDRGFVERFRVEAATLASIRHENLVQVYAFGQDGDHVYFVMELVEGEPLEDRIELSREEGRFLPVTLVAQVISQIGDALDALAQAGVLHRDVKPANVLLDRVRDRAVLVDVGIAKRRNAAHDPAGTPGFTAPEAFTGGAEGPSSDVYGLAATAYAMLTADLPFGEGSTETVLDRQIRNECIPPRKARHELPQEIEDLLLRALDPEPSQRPASAGEFALALAGALHRMDTGAVVEPARQERFLTERVSADEAIPVAIATEQPKIPLAKIEPAKIEVPRTRPVNSPAAVAATAIAPPAPAGDKPRPAAKPMPPSPVKQSVTPPRRATRVTGMAVVMARAASAEASEPHLAVARSRGVWFRATHRVLGDRQAATWIAGVTRDDPELGNALNTEHPVGAWHATPLFWRLLRAIEQSGRNATMFGQDLGRVSAAATFARFFGADPAALTPQQVFAAADTLWHAYHDWGTVSVLASGATSATVEIEVPPVAAAPKDLRPEVTWSHAASLFEEVARVTGALTADATAKPLSKGLRIQVVWEMPG